VYGNAGNDVGYYHDDVKQFRDAAKAEQTYSEPTFQVMRAGSADLVLNMTPLYAPNGSQITGGLVKAGGSTLVLAGNVLGQWGGNGLDISHAYVPHFDLPGGSFVGSGSSFRLITAGSLNGVVSLNDYNVSDANKVVLVPATTSISPIDTGATLIFTDLPAGGIAGSLTGSNTVASGDLQGTGGSADGGGLQIFAGNPPSPSSYTGTLTVAGTTGVTSTGTNGVTSNSGGAIGGVVITGSTTGTLNFGVPTNLVTPLTLDPGSIITAPDGSAQTLAAGQSLTVVGPATITTPGGQSILLHNGATFQILGRPDASGGDTTTGDTSTGDTTGGGATTGGDTGGDTTTGDTTTGDTKTGDTTTGDTNNSGTTTGDISTTSGDPDPTTTPTSPTDPA
jgi:hypothetical protein